ncbi:GIY-YIG nuclease family protein [Mucilaginibacter sp. AK015]|uniref:GIY-YIG nuclease family protein n=1 Tax=Mucilaginibacter sp. AK015 TaxID=2723072 RepID=UPI00161F0F3F|nr:GIY-YIG nuclease family protein [Mucilaginibacter sp. AK015]MBB5395135.1 putative GIY-YIG superfamily endonuclease [Mucilaginibacter sp. AK015]
MNIATFMLAYAKLSPSGRDYVCACPFHETVGQSMKLMPSADWFECTECDREGNLADLRQLMWEHTPVGRFCVYVLLLKNAHFYVGITDNLQRRIAEHFAGKGAEYTKRYQPLEVLEVFPNATYLLETKVTRDYMNKYGKDRVRGGIYCGFKYR